MSITHNYEVSVKWLNDRKGVLASKELNDEIEVATPPQFPNGMEGIWSPEHLFTAAVNSCLMTTFLAIAENSRLNYQQFESNASGKLEMVDGKYVMSEVTLKPVVTIENEEERARAERVLQKSEQNCLISNSITSKIIFEPTVNVLAKSEVI
ncbi:MAG: osmotically inducible protein OsmC [Bacteroidetes bacterium 43-93]|nr:OsmC family protein [Bacteroidota bacterium]OJX01137.1 MAG: osmotically inducible protein OsmC [Bacteroidetes bacterium 43-93]